MGVVDERSEIGGCYRGVPQNQLGMRTDSLDNCPNAEGLMMLVRSMAPEVSAADEIGTAKDVEAIEYAMHCGATMLTTVHGSGMDEIREKPLVSNRITPVESTQMDASPAALCFIRNIRFDTLIKFFVL